MSSFLSFQVSFSKMFRDIFMEIFCKKERGTRYMTEDASRAPAGGMSGSTERKTQTMTQLSPLNNQQPETVPLSSSRSQLNTGSESPVVVSNGEHITICEGEQTFVWMRAAFWLVNGLRLGKWTWRLKRTAYDVTDGWCDTGLLWCWKELLTPKRNCTVFFLKELMKTMEWFQDFKMAVKFKMTSKASGPNLDAVESEH